MHKLSQVMQPNAGQLMFVLAPELALPDVVLLIAIHSMLLSRRLAKR